MRQNIFGVTLAIILSCLFTCRTIAQSNWVDFNDERTRLMFDTNDDEEKDMAVGDFNNDGWPDIVVVRKEPFSVAGARTNLLLMNENGNLVDRTMQYIPTFITVPDNARDVIVFDADKDGWLDIVVANTFGSLHRLYMNRGNDGKGNWLGFEDQGSNGEWYSPPLPTNPQCCGIAVGDVDGDGYDDLFFVDYNNNLEARLFMNNHDGSFSDETLTRLSPAVRNQAFGTTAFMADMNGNGHIDIVSNDSFAFGGQGVEIFYNDGNGNFSQIQVLNTIASYMVAGADLNNNGRIDIYVVDDGQDYVFFNNSTNGNGTINTTRVFNSTSNLTVGFNGNIALADVDRDGWIDGAISDVDVDIPGCNRRFCLLRNNNGNNMFDPNNSINPLPWNVQGSHDSVWIDVNLDGHLDLFTATCVNYHMFVNDHPFVLGDVNLDDELNLLDVQPFIDRLISGQYQAQADINGDFRVDLLDIAGFVALLTGG